MTRIEKEMQKILANQPVAALAVCLNENGTMSYTWTGSTPQLVYMKEVIASMVSTEMAKSLRPEIKPLALVPVTPES